MKKLLLSLTLVFLGPLVACAQDQASAVYQEGVHYERLDVPLSSGSGGKIEVTEFFSYGCGHCYSFEPMLVAWKKQQADDVSVVGSPAVWRQEMEMQARLYYTSKALGVMEPMHQVIFDAIHRDRKSLASEQDVVALYEANGVSADDFRRAFGSFGVTSQVTQAASRARSARITGTPELMVAGKYRIETRKAGSQANMLKIADFLIAKERAARQ